MKMWNIGRLFVLILLTSACTDTADKLSRIGKAPPLSEVRNPQEDPSYKNLTWPLPKEVANEPQGPNSLWQKGSKAFFKDQRAMRVGDILRIKVVIDDKAELDNETKRDRTSDENLSIPGVMGFQADLKKLFRHSPSLDGLVDISGSGKNQGKGSIGRKEKIETELAAIVTQILPNGNMAIQGKQEIRVNGEVREVFVGGVIRPEDIASDNTIQSYQIAEARISYGGRGSLSDIQQPRWGSQVLDAISPF